MTPENCPNCGADVPARAKACPACGADEQTGWSEQAYAGGLTYTTNPSSTTTSSNAS